MRRRQNQISLLIIALVTTFSVVVTWPGDPDKYLPDFIPWPGGGGLNIGDFDRDEFRLGLDLAGGVSVTLEASGSSTNGVAETVFEGVVPGSTAGGDNTAQIRFISMDPTMDLRAKQDAGTDVSAAFLGQVFA